MEGDDIKDTLNEDDEVLPVETSTPKKTKEKKKRLPSVYR
jgi:hypothetical protein